jgi:predicted nucleic acid-binding protein
MRIAVQDANILFDIECAGLLPLWFDLKIETHITSLIADEIKSKKHQQLKTCLQSKKIIVHQLTPDQKLEAQSLAMEVSGLTRADASCFQLAQTLDATLLTGDSILRRYAKAQCLPVHGTLWILDQLIEAKLLKPKDAIEKLVIIRQENTYLPEKECQIRIVKWQKLT